MNEGEGILNPHDSKSRTVLVADDDHDLLGYIKFRFGARGVLDVRMPKLDGFEVTRRIRVNDDVREMPVILLTASTEPSDMRAGYEAGADDYLRKPFSAPDELITSVYSQLKRS